MYYLCVHLQDADCVHAHIVNGTLPYIVWSSVLCMSVLVWVVGGGWGCSGWWEVGGGVVGGGRDVCAWGV